ncbi:hypothetical protein PEC301877_41790 [Pectobacterium carotovorum subsp. carotovorum]|nr:hypothetical protein PEC301877_41790 [Pectobacterium carotovorum subsp. carotovorum]
MILTSSYNLARKLLLAHKVQALTTAEIMVIFRTLDNQRGINP